MITIVRLLTMPVVYVTCLAFSWAYLAAAAVFIGWWIGAPPDNVGDKV